MHATGTAGALARPPPVVARCRKTTSGPKLTPGTILVTKHVARGLARGCKARQDLERAIVATARRPAHERACSNCWANPGSAFDPATCTVGMHMRMIIRNEGGALTDPPPRFPEVPEMGKIYTVTVMQAGVTAILVTGDADRNKVQTVPGENHVTIEIRLPPNWDALIADRGHRPPSEFFLEQEESRPRRRAEAPNAGGRS